jgi:hypothetical protein
MSEPVKDDDSIAEKLNETRWDYSQREDRRFLLDPIGRIFGLFCWDGRPRPVIQPPLRLPDEDD